MNCPDNNEILGFIDGSVSASESLQLEEHIAACTECRSLVAELGRSIDEPSTRWDAHSGGDVVGPGSKVGRYLIVERLGAGAMGVVYRARDSDLDRDVALKLVRVIGLAPEAAERARERLLKEAVAMARLAEPNVVTVYDASIVGEAVFVAMELVDGVTLDAWLTSDERSWREIVGAFAEAGRGLVAAHEAAVVHRDFKPANVLVGPGSRVRVTDFGLATVKGEQEFALGSVPELDLEQVCEVKTASGTVMGTPAYMSPEARSDGIVDERSDQYSFAVSLCEALAKERPAGGVLPSMNAPSRVVRILERALSKDPDQRFPSMNALVTELTSAARPVAKRIAIAATVVVAVGAAAVIGFAAASNQTGDPCTAGADRIGAVWNSDLSAKAKQSFDATKIPYAADVFESARKNLDGFAADWKAGYRDACEATHVRHEQSEALLDLRMQCLSDALRPFVTATELFANASTAIVSRAISISTMQGLRRCASVATLTRETPRPGGAQAAAEINRISDEYDAIRKLSLEGKQAEALAAVTGLVPAVKAVGYDRMEAEIIGYLGEMKWRSGKLEEAEELLYAAVGAAERAHSDDIRAGTMSVIVAVIGFEQGRHDEALEIARLAELALLAIDDRGRLANLISNRGSIHFGRNDIDSAEADYKRARTIMADVYGPDDPRTGQILNNIALIAENRGNHAEAVVAYGEALAVYEKSLGPGHPQIALTVANRASSYANLGDNEKATADIERALKLRTETLGAEHPEVGATHRIMGQFANAGGDPITALKHAKLGHTILVASLGSEHFEVASANAVIGEAQVRLKRYEEASQTLRLAIATWEKLEMESPLLATARYNLAMALWPDKESRSEALALARSARDQLADQPDSVAEITEWLKARE